MPKEKMKDPLVHSRECFSSYMGMWAIESEFMKQSIASLKAGWLKPIAARHDHDDSDLFVLTEDGIAIIPIVGLLMKARSKFGGTSTIEARQAVRAAVNNKQVKSILLHIDSPGGTVAGTQELADDVSAANKEKPVFAHIDDLGASAAFWIASQATRITANRTAVVGSIGTLLIIEDSSKLFETAGIKIHIISTGEFKGAGVDGTEITKNMLKQFQIFVDDLNVPFLGAVESGRGMSAEQVAKIADGRAFIAEKAKGFGLIDAVQSLDITMQEISESNAAKDNNNNNRMRIANNFIKLSEV